MLSIDLVVAIVATLAFEVGAKWAFCHLENRRLADELTYIFSRVFMVAVVVALIMT